MLLMDVKSAFDHISWSCLLRTIERMEADGDLMGWMNFFMSDRGVSVVIDVHQYEVTAVNTSVSQGLPILSIHFAIYLSGVFTMVKKGVEGYVVTSFAEDDDW